MVVVGRRPYFPVGTDPFTSRSNRNPLENLDWKNRRRSRWETRFKTRKGIWGVDKTTHCLCPSLCGTRPSSRSYPIESQAFRSRMDGTRVRFPRNHSSPEGHAFSRKVLRLLRLPRTCGQASNDTTSSTRATSPRTVAPPVSLDCSGLCGKIEVLNPTGLWESRVLGKTDLSSR